MLLAIFGAGASYDSVDLDLMPDLALGVRLNSKFRPPLANQLFDERPDFIEAMNRYPNISMLIPRLRQAAKDPSKTVEMVLREIQEEADDYPERKSHLMALEFYLCDILDRPVTRWLTSAGRATNYAGLLDQITYVNGHTPSLFVTFNYDELLEAAFNDVTMHEFTNDLDSYINGIFALIKPHGSVNWAQQLTAYGNIKIKGSLQEIAIAAAAQLDFTGIEIITRGRFNQPWHPAIAIPLDRTKTFVCPQKHLERLSSDLADVTHVLVVGWRATEQHFLSKLEERLPKNRSLSLCVVDKDDGADVALGNLNSALSKVISFGPVETHKNGFSEFVREGRVRTWLSPSV